MKPPLKKALFLLAYGLGVFILFEGVARIAVSTSAFFGRIAMQDDSSWRLRWIKRHSDASEILYQFDAYHPTRGWAVKANVRDASVFAGKVLNSNSKGLRGKREFAYDRTKGLTRIVLLGDSFTFGDEVSDSETYAGVLQERSPGAEIINLGVHGYGHDQMLIYFDEEGVKYRPDIVLLGFVYIDMTRNLLEFRDFAKPRFELVDGGLVLQNSPVPTPQSILGSEFRRLKLLDLVEILHQSLRWRNGANERQSQSVTAALLVRLADSIKAQGSMPLFVYLPMPEDMAIPAGATNVREQYLRELCERHQIPCFSLTPAFRDSPPRMRALFLDYHWSPEGHRRAAIGIHDYLRQHGLAGD